MQNFSTDKFSVTVNDRIIESWGSTNPPVSVAEIDPPSQLIRGQGGGAVRFDRKNPGMRVTLNLLPGSADSAFVQGLKNTNANISASFRQIGTLEVAVGSEGVIVSRGTTGRGGSSVSDDQYVIEFNGWTESRGGE